jgi:hypothetical protein
MVVQSNGCGVMVERLRYYRIMVMLSESNGSGVME